MLTARTPLRLVALGVALLLCLLGGPALAKQPTRPGSVKGLSLTVSKPGAAYRLASSWNASTHATSYAVRLTNAAGSVLGSARVLTTSWTTSATAHAGDALRITVTPYNGTRKGPTASLSRALPDLTAPTGSYDTVVTGRSATLSELAISDDVTPAVQIQRTVDWGDGSPTATWTPALSHPYPASPVLARYVPTMTLRDLAGNQVTITLPTVALADSDAPTGVFSAGPGNGWARYTRVVLTQTALSDNLSPVATIERTVVWGDGATSTWTAGTTTIGHVYATAGSYSPSVLLTDEAHNTSPAVPSSTVTLKQDTTAPRVTLRLPTQPRTVARKWAYLHGRATDAGVGVRSLRVRAVEKRGPYFYAYQPATRTWQRAGTTAAVALRHAAVRTVLPTSTGTWTVRLAGLTVGTLSYRVVGVDRVGNSSRAVRHAQLLTRR